MRRRVPVTIWFSLVLVSAGLYGKKKPKVAPAPAVPQMTQEQKTLHALNRLTFGARAGDLDDVQAIGLERWIDAQLHPETIAENTVLEARLAPLDTSQKAKPSCYYRPVQQPACGGQILLRHNPAPLQTGSHSPLQAQPSPLRAGSDAPR